jgi:hypothetical protein
MAGFASAGKSKSVLCFSVACKRAAEKARAIMRPEYHRVAIASADRIYIKSKSMLLTHPATKVNNRAQGNYILRG